MHCSAGILVPTRKGQSVSSGQASPHIGGPLAEHLLSLCPSQVCPAPEKHKSISQSCSTEPLVSSPGAVAHQLPGGFCSCHSAVTSWPLSVSPTARDPPSTNPPSGWGEPRHLQLAQVHPTWSSTPLPDAT